MSYLLQNVSNPIKWIHCQLRKMEDHLVQHFNIVKRCTNWNERKILEAVFINDENPTVNDQTDFVRTLVGLL